MEELPRRNLWRWAWVVLAILIVILGILFVRNKTPGKQGRQSPVKSELLRGQRAIGRHETVGGDLSSSVEQRGKPDHEAFCVRPDPWPRPLVRGSES